MWAWFMDPKVGGGKLYCNQISGPLQTGGCSRANQKPFLILAKQMFPRHLSATI